MARIKVNLTLDAEFAEAARDLGLNMSRLAEAAKQERNSRWRQQNAGAIAAYSEEVSQGGLPLAQYRSRRRIARAGRLVGSLASHRDALRRALDILFDGP